MQKQKATARNDLLVGILLSGAAAYLCYRSLFGFLSALIIIPFYRRMRAQIRLQEAEQEMMAQFCSALQTISGSLRTGNSLENAFIEAEKELPEAYGKQAVFYRGLVQINRRVRMNEPIEDLFLLFAYNTGISEICTFAETFRYAKQSGANMPAMIREMVDWIREKETILEDIRTQVTAKRMEQRMMLFLVPGVLLFVTAGSPEYTQALYHSLPGVLLMTGCLLGYLTAVWWGRRIVSIQV